MKISCLVSFTLVFSFLSSFGIAPADLDNLGLKSPLPAAIDLEDVTASGNTVIAGGLFGILVISEDGGVSWREADPIPGFGSTDGIQYLSNNGTDFVASSYGGRLFRSTDLENWSEARIFATISDMDQGKGLFVITATSGEKIYVTADGSSPVAASSLPANLPAMRGVAFGDVGDGVFVAGGDEGTLIRSTDGQTWQEVFSGIPGRSGSSDRFDFVSYANGLFFATGSNSLIYTSPDGQTWTLRTPDESGNYRNVAYVGGTYIFGNSLSGTYTTTDLVDFESNSWNGANGTNEGFAMVGSTLINVGRAGYIGTSTDGLNWTERRQRLGDRFGSVAYGVEKFVICDESEGRIFTSPDGSTWTFVHQLSEAYRTGVVQGGERFVIVGNSFVATSTDGTLWTEERHNLSHLPDSVHFVNGRFIVLGRSGEVSESSDGIGWTERDTGTGNWLYDIDYGDGVYAIANASNVILTSPDLITWNLRPTGAAGGESFTDIAFDGSRFLAGRTFRDFTLSEDGVNWSMIEDSPSFAISELNHDPGLGFYITGTQGTIRFTDSGLDSSSWTSKRLPVAISILGLAEGGGSVVAVGNTGLIMSTVAGDFGFSGWIMQNFPGITDPETIGMTVDPDRDGASNFEEYARSTDPNEITPPLVVELDRPAFGARITWTQAAPPEGVVATAEYTTNLLTGWETAGLILESADNFDGTVTYAAQVTGVAGQGDSLFLRVRWFSE